MPETLAVACIQMRSNADIAENIRTATALTEEAARQGAQLIVTPEMTSFFSKTENLAEHARPEKDDTALAAFQTLAARLGIWLMPGSIPIRVSEGKCANRSFLISPSGDIAARYDKIHLFDVSLDAQNIYRESDRFEGGHDAVTADIDGIRVGMTICYDLRFPHLYRAMAQAGAKIITVPSAFTAVTGRAHWHVLLRARAIENGCFILAAAQGGKHIDGRETYGHSMIVDPWGDIIAEADDAPGYITATLDLGLADAARGKIPSLKHDQDFALKNS